MRNINKIVVHHTGTPQSTTVESIRHYHTKVLGWKDIGYHYLIEAGGTLRLGRPDGIIGAHTKGLNRESIGIALIGNYMGREPNPYALNKLSILLRDLYYQFPYAKVVAHREVAPTLCPGDKLHDWLCEWRIGDV